jgi:tetratricopeptide (TPR) repeat protein
MSEEDDLFHTTIPLALEALEHSDSFEAITRLLAAGEPRRVMQCFHWAVRELFSQRKMPEMVWIGRAGTEYALREAHATENAALRNDLHAAARKLSYNVSSHLWPGWADDAVHPTTSDLRSALDLARVHLRLALEAGLDAESNGNARWLVGAQQLALGQVQTAQDAFDTAKAAYQQAGRPASEGFVALSLHLLGATATEGQRRFDAAIGELRRLGDDGEFFADQLRTAWRVFSTR